MFNELLETLVEFSKKYSPLIVGGLIGSVIHRLRTDMTIKQFIGSIIMSVFVALSVGIICQEYLEIKKDAIIFVACGISGTFSKVLLDELEEIISTFSVIFKKKIGIEEIPQEEEI